MDKQLLISGHYREAFVIFIWNSTDSKKQGSDMASRINELARTDLFPDPQITDLIDKTVPAGKGFYDLPLNEAGQLIDAIANLPSYQQGIKSAGARSIGVHVGTFFSRYRDFIAFMDVTKSAKDYLISETYRKDEAKNSIADQTYQEFLTAFPVAKLGDMKIEDYVLGLQDSNGNTAHSFCWFVEYRLDLWGDIAGGSADKFGVRYDGKISAYKVCNKRLDSDPQTAFQQIRADLVRLSQTHGPSAMMSIKSSVLPNALKNKVSYLYNRDSQLCIYADAPVRNVALFLDLPVQVSQTTEEVRFAIFDYCQKSGLVTLFNNNTRLLSNFLWNTYALRPATNNAAEEQEEKEETEEEVPAQPAATSHNYEGKNLLFYGVPGCGKSYYVSQHIAVGGKVFRTTFYRDYSYSDFVGQIMPMVNESNGQPVYGFAPGPFSKALLYALTHLDEKVYLIIEEINRGNAPAIFGDIFQLLDREHGLSVYPIENPQLAHYLTSQGVSMQSCCASEKIANANEDTIILPGNLSIVGTMNTSDQSVFVLDNAFKRRFSFVRVSNEPRDDDTITKKYVPGTDKTWIDFLKKINERIVSTSDSPFEDKQLGIYFANGILADAPNIGDIELKRAFAMKVLEYLYDDVARSDRADWFTHPDNFDLVIEDFVNQGLLVFKFAW